LGTHNPSDNVFTALASSDAKVFTTIPADSGKLLEESKKFS
jgi:hypothetical protein